MTVVNKGVVIEESAASLMKLEDAGGNTRVVVMTQRAAVTIYQACPVMMDEIGRISSGGTNMIP